MIYFAMDSHNDLRLLYLHLSFSLLSLTSRLCRLITSQVLILNCFFLDVIAGLNGRVDSRPWMAFLGVSKFNGF
jgi:hypothetical protein